MTTSLDQFGGPPHLQTWPRSVALYSGGVDSYCMAYLHDPDVLLHVHMGGRYGSAETANIEVPPGMWPRVKTIPARVLGQYEDAATKIIPGRNAMLALFAANYGDNILMGSVAGSNGRDKDQEFADRLNHLFEHMYGPQKGMPEGRTVRMHLPVHDVTKAQLVGAVLATGHDPELLVHNTFSCYEPTSHDKVCGKCPPCGRKWAAFTVWGVDVGFDGREAFRPYIDELEAGHTAHRPDQFWTDVTDAWHGHVRTPGVQSRTAPVPPKIGSPS